jgi:hypothetical protein
MWDQDRIDFASTTVALGRLQRLMRQLSPDFGREVEHPPSGRRVLLTQPDSEQHMFGLSMVAEFFRREGWDVLGGVAGVGIEPIAWVRRDWFDVVGFSLGSELGLPWLRDTIAAVRLASRNASLVVLVGGPMFSLHPHWAGEVGADATTDGRRWRQVNHAVAGRDDIPVSYTAFALDEQAAPKKPALLALGRDLRATVAAAARLVDAQQAMERDYWRFREAETRYRTLFQTSSEAVLIADGAELQGAGGQPGGARPVRQGPGRLAGAALLSLFDTASHGDDLQTCWRPRARRAGGERACARLACWPRRQTPRSRCRWSVFRQDNSRRSCWCACAGAAPRRRPCRRCRAGLPRPTRHRRCWKPTSARPPDALVFTDGQGRILRANRGLRHPGAAQHRRAGARRDAGPLAGPHRRGAGRADHQPAPARQWWRFHTVLRGEYGAEHEVEISATRLTCRRRARRRWPSPSATSAAASGQRARARAAGRVRRASSPNWWAACR